MTVIRYAKGDELESRYKGEIARASVDSEKGIKEIVLFGKPTAVTLAHEIAHFRLGHMDAQVKRGYSSTEDYIKDEVEAWVDAYRRLKRPKHLTQRLMGIVVVTLGYKEFNTKQILYLLGKELQREGVPKAWRSDFEKVKAEVGREDN